MDPFLLCDRVDPTGGADRTDAGTPSTRYMGSPLGEPVTIETASAAVREALRVAGDGLVDRQTLCQLIALGAVAREHLLVIGPPGTAKSEAVRRVSKTLGAQTFEYLLGRFTEPSELVGPVDLRKLRDGIVETRVEGMLPEAEFAFLDEVFLGSTAILNTLLGILADRQFRRGHTRMSVPLRVCVGASNAVPTDVALAAFADRFLLQVWVEPVAEELLEDLLHGGAGLQDLTEPIATVEQLDELAEAARAADPTDVVPDIAHAVRKLRRAGVVLSDRRVVKLQRLVCAAAVLSGRHTPTRADLWPIVYAVPDPDGQRLTRDTLRPLLAESESASLADAAAHASLGPAARAQLLVGKAEEVLGSYRSGEAWTLAAEDVLRAIDGGFEAEHLSDALADVRRRLLGRLA